MADSRPLEAERVAWTFSCGRSRDCVEGNTQWRCGFALAIAQERLTDHIERNAILQGQAANNGRVFRCDVRCRVRLAIAQEDFSDVAIGETADGGDVAEAATFKSEQLGWASIGKSLAAVHAHR